MASYLYTGPRPSRLMWLLALSGVLWLAALLAVSHAQITLDGSLGPRGPLTGPNYRIDANVGQLRGSNLFHSFEQFNVRMNERATFTGPNTIANIVSRVTGGQQSFIDGQLRSTIAGANLFLLNPSGVLFGSNASLNVSGAFHVSTADFLRFADGAKFSAHLGQESVLTVASPAAFGFLGPTPAPITIQESVLEVPTGKTLSIIGGDIEIVGGRLGFLASPSGRIQLASVASPGEVIFSPLELAPDLQVDSFTRLGRLALSQGALLDASGNPGGTVLLRSGHLRLDNALISAINLGNAESPGFGIDVQVRGDVAVNGGRLLTGSDPTSGGSVGDIRVHAGTVTLTGGGIIASLAQGLGKGGNVTVSARESVLIAGQDDEGTPSGIGNFAAGDPGRISLSAPTVTIENDGVVGASSVVVSGFVGGRAGDITVEADRLTLRRGGSLISSTQTEQPGGTVTVRGSESISISGSGISGASGIFSGTLGPGHAGRIAISTPLLTMDNGLIEATTSGAGHAGNIDLRGGRFTLTGGAAISTSTSGSGRGGTVTVLAAEALSIVGEDQEGFPSGLSSNTFASGDAGRLLVFAPTLTMQDGAIQALTEGSGNAGGLEVQVERLALTGGAQISTSTFGEGRGGTVTVTATESVTIAGRDSQGSPSGLFSRTEGPRPGGDLQVAAPFIQLRDGGIVSARSTSSGEAGTVCIQAGETFHSQRGTVTTGATRAGGGRIELRAGRLVQLQDSAVTTSVRGGGG
jgi:filamentous hemagglutinin family protein